MYFSVAHKLVRILSHANDDELSALMPMRLEMGVVSGPPQTVIFKAGDDLRQVAQRVHY